MAYGRTVRRGGPYNRLVEPDWNHPLDTSYAKERGGRWNPRGAFGALYLNASIRTARVQVVHKLAGQPYGVEDLDEAEQHDLVEVQVAQHSWLDCLTDAGLTAVGLPAGYPQDPHGQRVGWEDCQSVGQVAYDTQRSGVACRSAAAGASRDDEELAVFDTDDGRVQMTGRRPFADWFWGS